MWTGDCGSLAGSLAAHTIVGFLIQVKPPTKAMSNDCVWVFSRRTEGAVLGFVGRASFVLQPQMIVEMPDPVTRNT
jgi:hypothetical protein